MKKIFKYILCLSLLFFPSSAVSLAAKNDNIIFSFENPLTGRVSSFFGYRIHPITNKLDFHPAIDICAPHSSYIRSISSGKIKEIGRSEIYGNYIIISHSNNTESKYCHCNKILKKVNSRVLKGEIISTVGNTGLVTGDHLHLEIKINNIAVDPTIFINFNLTDKEDENDFFS